MHLKTGVCVSVFMISKLCAHTPPLHASFIQFNNTAAVTLTLMWLTMHLYTLRAVEGNHTQKVFVIDFRNNLYCTWNDTFSDSALDTFKYKSVEYI